MFIRCRILCGAVLAAALLCLPWAVPASAQQDVLSKFQKSKADELPQLAEKALDHLFKAVSDPGLAVDPEALRPLLAFVADHVVDPEDLDMEKRYSSRGVCREFALAGSLSRVLRYHFNPGIPGQLVLPQAVRQTAWISGSGILALDEPLWTLTGRLESGPVVLRGMEHEVNAPNADGGVWYAYDMDRLMVLLAFRGRPAFVSVSLQLEDSSIGRKAATLSNDAWLYFYSQETGLNRSGIGWADTYIYRAASVNVFLEQEGGQATDMAHFKWLDAGWKGLNMVGKSDLLDGSASFVKSFQASMTSLPEPEALEEVGRWSRQLSGADLERLTRAYALDFEAAAKGNEAMEDFLDEVRDGGYARILDQDAARALLALERLKCLAGKPALGGVCQEP